MDTVAIIAEKQATEELRKAIDQLGQAIAKAGGALGGLPRTVTDAGRAAFMSPEQAGSQGARSVDRSEKSQQQAERVAALALATQFAKGTCGAIIRETLPGILAWRTENRRRELQRRLEKLIEQEGGAA